MCGLCNILFLGENGEIYKESRRYFKENVKINSGRNPRNTEEVSEVFAEEAS